MQEKFIIVLAIICVLFFSQLAYANDDDSMPETTLINGLQNPYPAPLLTGMTAWINSPALDIHQLQGKTLLIHFWSYSSIHCLRSIQHLQEWNKKYHDKGLMIIGIQSPRFDFESNVNNLKNAVKKYQIYYPIGLDARLIVWKNYNNKRWPMLYLVNKQGEVIFEQAGEGQYDVIENNIRYLLNLSNTHATIDTEKNYLRIQPTDISLSQTQTENFYSPEIINENHPAHYTYPEKLPANSWALRGEWIIAKQKIISAQAGAAIKIHFHASKLFAVMATTTKKPAKIKVLFNGKLITNNFYVIDSRLYSIVEFKHPTNGTLELIALQPGLELYEFSFGS